MSATEYGLVRAFDQCGPDAMVAVGSDGHADTTAANKDTAVDFPTLQRLAEGGSIIRVVVIRVDAEWSEVNDLDLALSSNSFSNSFFGDTPCRPIPNLITPELDCNLKMRH